MPAGNVQPVRTTNNKKSRRRKKRRTAESSDSDSSSSNSESSTEEFNASEETKDADEASDVELSEAEIDMIKAENASLQELDDTTKDKLSSITLTVTDLARRGADSSNSSGVDLKKVSQMINSSRKELQNSVLASDNGSTEDVNNLKNGYLNLLFENYGDDIAKFRDAPDFTPKSLVLLANVLKEGSNMFDTKTLRTILDSK